MRDSTTKGVRKTLGYDGYERIEKTKREDKKESITSEPATRRRRCDATSLFHELEERGSRR